MQKGHYALKETTSSKSKKLTPTRQITSEQNSSQKAKNNVHINGNLTHRKFTCSSDGLPKLDLHSSPSYDTNGSISPTDRPELLQQLSDGTEVTLINPQSSIRSRIEHDPVNKPVVLLQPQQPPKSDENLSPTALVTTFLERPGDKTNAGHFDGPGEVGIQEKVTLNKTPEPQRPEARRGPPVPSKPKPIFISRPENEKAKVVVAVKPLNIPEIDTTNLMSSPDWAEIVHHLPDDVAETIISTSRPVSGHYNEGLLFPPTTDGLRSLSSTPTRLESELESLASSFVSLNKNIEESFAAKQEDQSGDGTLPTEVPHDVKDVQSEVEENTGSVPPEVTNTMHSSDSFDENTDSQPAVIESFDPPPASYEYIPEDNTTGSTLGNTDSENHWVPSVNGEEPTSNDRHSSGCSNDGSDDGDEVKSVDISVISIPGRNWQDGDPTSAAQNRSEEQTREDEPPVNDAIRREKSSADSVPEHNPVARTSSYLPPMPLNIGDAENYRMSGEFPPPPPPEHLWPPPVDVESIVQSDHIPLVDESAPAGQFGYQSAGSQAETNAVHLRHIDNGHPPIDNRISVVSTIPPSPTTTTTDVSWTSDLSKETANASVI